MENIKFKVETIQQILETPYFPIGIKIIRNINQKWDSSFQEVADNKRFCYYVRLAAQGKKYVVKNDSNLECYTPFLCLGLKEPKYTDFEPRIKPANTKAILIGPLHELKDPIDSIIFIVNAKQAMVLSSALRSFLKKKIDATFGASMAVCGEIVAYVIMNQIPNLSLLCEGARMYSAYANDELVFGIPFHMFDGLYKNLKRREEMLASIKHEINSEVNQCLDLQKTN